MTPGRDPVAAEQIAAARAPSTGIELAMEELDAQVAAAQAAYVDPPLAYRDGVFAIDAPRTDVTTLTGPAHEAFRAFADVCARMETHNKASSAIAAALNKEYIAVLERFSAIAAKAGAR